MESTRRLCIVILFGLILLIGFCHSKNKWKKSLQMESTGSYVSRKCPIVPQVEKHFGLKTNHEFDEVAKYSFKVFFYFPPLSRRSMMKRSIEQQEPKFKDCTEFEKLTYDLFLNNVRNYQEVIHSYGLNEVLRTQWPESETPFDLMDIGMNNRVKLNDEEFYSQDSDIPYEEGHMVEIRIEEGSPTYQKSILRIYSDGNFELIPFGGLERQGDILPSPYQLNFRLGPAKRGKVRASHQIRSVYILSHHAEGFTARVHYKGNPDQAIRVRFLLRGNTPELTITSLENSKSQVLFGQRRFFEMSFHYPDSDRTYERILYDGEIFQTSVPKLMSSLLPSIFSPRRHDLSALPSLTSRKHVKQANDSNELTSDNFCFCDVTVPSHYLDEHGNNETYYGPCVCLDCELDDSYKSDLLAQILLDLFTGLSFIAILMCTVCVVNCGVNFIRRNEILPNRCSFDRKTDAFCYCIRLGCLSVLLQCIRLAFTISQITLVYTTNIRLEYLVMKSIFFFQTCFLFVSVLLEESLDTFQVCSRKTKQTEVYNGSNVVFKFLSFCFCNCIVIRKFFFVAWNIILQVWALVALDCVYYFGHRDVFYDLLKASLFFQILNFLIEVAIIFIDLERYFCGTIALTTTKQEEKQEVQSEDANVEVIELKDGGEVKTELMVAMMMRNDDDGINVTDEDLEKSLKKKKMRQQQFTKAVDAKKRDLIFDDDDDDDYSNNNGEEIVVIEEEEGHEKVVDVYITKEYDEQTQNSEDDETDQSQTEDSSQHHQEEDGDEENTSFLSSLQTTEVIIDDLNQKKEDDEDQDDEEEIMLDVSSSSSSPIKKLDRRDDHQHSQGGQKITIIEKKD